MKFGMMLLMSLLGFACLAEQDNVLATAGRDGEPTKVLILTGAEMSAHNWETRTQALEEILAGDSRFVVAV